MLSKKKKVIALIQARVSSKRLPRKVLRKIADRTPIEWIGYRLSFCKEVDTIILATSTNPENDVLEAHAQEIGMECFRGSENDLINRCYDAAQEYAADAIVRVCADCPLVDPEIVDELVSIYKNGEESIDFICNNIPPTYPHGLDVEVIPTRTLKRLKDEVKKPLYREWLTMTIIENQDRYTIRNSAHAKNLQDLRLTLDYEEDLVLLEEIFKRLHKDGEVFLLKDIEQLFMAEPRLKDINARWVSIETKDNVRKNSEFQELKEKK
jgi:spore coat polysaccharide biosynthesis protein SpsF